MEEATDADLLLHVVDLADDDPEAKVSAVREALTAIGADRVPEVLVGSKADIATVQPLTVSWEPIWKRSSCPPRGGRVWRCWARRSGRKNTVPTVCGSGPGCR